MFMTLMCHVTPCRQRQNLHFPCRQRQCRLNHHFHVGDLLPGSFNASFVLWCLILTVKQDVELLRDQTTEI